MLIVFVTHYTDLYGANRSMLGLIGELKKKDDVDINVIAPAKGAVCDELKKIHVKYHVIPFVNEFYDYRKPQSLLKKISKRYYNYMLVAKHKHLFKNKNVIVHSNASVTFFGAYLAESLGAPHVWHVREFGKEDYNQVYNFGKKHLSQYLTKASAIICVSNAVCRHRFASETSLPVKVIYNGIISEKKLQTAIKPAVKDNVFRFGIAGLISPLKNQAEAIEAFNIIKDYCDCELLIAGAGDDNFIDELKTLINKYNLQNKIKLTGFTNDIYGFYRSINCLLVCARNEALGRTIIEAMSIGLPVIGYDNGGTPEIVKEGYNGFLYKGGYNELSEKMKNVIKNYNNLAGLSEHAVQTVRDNFTTESNAREVFGIYNNILGKASVAALN